jgi:hypothetical protein
MVKSFPFRRGGYRSSMIDSCDKPAPADRGGGACWGEFKR